MQWQPILILVQPWWCAFISLSTEHEFDSKSEQFAFLEADLKSAQGKQPFIVVFGHRPLLSSHEGFGKDHDSMSKRQWDVWMPLFEKYHVDLTLWGHVHGYERAMSSGLPIITSGGAGQGYCCGPWEYNPPDWSIFREDSHMYLRIEVNLAQSPPTMNVEMIRSDDGRVYDAFKVHARDSLGFHKPLLETMPQQSDATTGSTSIFVPRQSNSAEGTCSEEVYAPFPVEPVVPAGLCPTNTYDGELFI